MPKNEKIRKRNESVLALIKLKTQRKMNILLNKHGESKL